VASAGPVAGFGNVRITPDARRQRITHRADGQSRPWLSALAKGQSAYFDIHFRLKDSALPSFRARLRYFKWERGTV
jgi:hypothetical protein